MTAHFRYVDIVTYSNNTPKDNQTYSSRTQDMESGKVFLLETCIRGNMWTPVWEYRWVIVGLKL